jgi:hypothetical protein
MFDREEAYIKKIDWTLNRQLSTLAMILTLCIGLITILLGNINFYLFLLYEFILTCILYFIRRWIRHYYDILNYKGKLTVYRRNLGLPDIWFLRFEGGSILPRFFVSKFEREKEGIVTFVFPLNENRVYLFLIVILIIGNLFYFFRYDSLCDFIIYSFNFLCG